MSTKDISTSFNAGNVAYQPWSPTESRANKINFAATSIGASGTDTVHLLPLNPGEVLLYAFLRVDVPGNASTTVTLTDSRNAGAVLAASAADAAANTVYKGAG